MNRDLVRLLPVYHAIAASAMKKHQQRNFEKSSELWIIADSVLSLYLEKEPVRWEDLDYLSVRKMRLLRRLTVQELAVTVGLDDSHISWIEMGKYKNIQEKTKKKLFEVLTSLPVLPLGVELKYLREKAKITREVLSIHSGIDIKFISKLENETLDFQQKGIRNITGSKNRKKIELLTNSIDTYEHHQDHHKNKLEYIRQTIANMDNVEHGSIIRDKKIDEIYKVLIRP